MIISEALHDRKARLNRRNGQKLLFEIEHAIHPRIMAILDQEEGERFELLWENFRKRREEKLEKVRERRRKKKI